MLQLRHTIGQKSTGCKIPKAIIWFIITNVCKCKSHCFLSFKVLSWSHLCIYLLWWIVLNSPNDFSSCHCHMLIFVPTNSNHIHFITAKLTLLYKETNKNESKPTVSPTQNFNQWSTTHLLQQCNFYTSVCTYIWIIQTTLTEVTVQGPDFRKILWRTYDKLTKKSDLRKN